MPSGAFEAATGITEVAGGAASREFRIVPIGPMHGDVELLYGHPDSTGRHFVMRIRELPGTIVPPHSHPVDEHITVVSGTWFFGRGERFDSTALRELRTGAYAFAPAGTVMFGYSPDGAVVQVHGIGPFHIHWRDRTHVLSEPVGAGVFAFRRGDVVASPRGTGRIRQGYASGTIIQYEIEGADGRLFMVSEHQLSAVQPGQSAPPWSRPALAAGDVPSVYLAEWRAAPNRSTCALLAPAQLDAEYTRGATPRAATFSGGWAVAYDAADIRGAFGIAGSGSSAWGEGIYDEWPVKRAYSDGSRAGYGLEGGTGPNWLAYVHIPGQDCLYNVWSRRGQVHLESLLEQLRFVDVR